MNCNLATPPTPHCRTAGRGGTVAQNEMRPAALERPDLVAHFNGRIISDNEQRQDYGRRDPRARGESVSAPVSVIPADSPCRTAILVPVELEQRLREAVSRCAATLGESPERCRRAVEIAVLQRGLDALEARRG